LALVAVLLVAFGIGLALRAGDARRGQWPGETRWYGGRSPWNTPIQASAGPVRDSTRLVALLAHAGRAINVNSFDWTPPVYVASRSTALQTVEVADAWRHYRILAPIPMGARPSADADGPDPPPTPGDNYLMVVDRSTGCEYDFWKAYRDEGGTWHAVAVATFDIHGSGVHRGRGIRASSFALGGGLLRPSDFTGGIHHALGWAVPSTISGSSFVSPAQHTDGRAPNGIPMGTLFQLDPSLDLGSFRPALSPWQMTVARAMQRYGVYVFDSATGAIALTAQSDIGGAKYPFPRYSQLPGALLSKLRVVASPVTKPALDTTTPAACARRRGGR
jgi:hypothetical protein